MLTFRQIEAFRYLYLTGKTTSASQLLSISQPAVSRLLSDLEKELGLTLFERHGRRLKVTQEADALYEEVQRAYVGLERIKEAADNIKEYPQGKLCIVVIPSIEATIGFDLVERFKKENPKASVALEIQSTNQAIEWIRSRQANMAIAHPHFRQPGMEYVVINRAPAVAIVSRDHALAGKDVLHPSDFNGAPFVSFRPDSLFRTQLDRMFGEHNVRRDMKFECRTAAAVCRMVSRGFGVSVVGPHLSEMSEHNLAIRKFKPDIPVELALIWPSSMKHGVLERQMIAIIEDHFGVATGILR